MQADCYGETLVFGDMGRRKVVGEFDGGHMSSDGGALLLREAEQKFDIIDRLAACFADYRDPSRVEHSVQRILGQRIFGLCLGYEDLNDHNRVRDDAVLALAAGRQDITGAQRVRARDKGHPLAGASTLNRFELGDAKTAPTDRYKRIAGDVDKIDALLVDLFTESREAPPERIILDIDATDEVLHGRQEGRFFHGYYGHYCYLPLYIMSGNHVLAARLRPSNIDGAQGSVEELSRVVAQIRQQWPQVEIWIRGDGGFCREELMAWCEENDLKFILGLSRNTRLQERIAAEMEESRQQCEATSAASRRFKSFEYRTLKSWSCARRVVAKAEWLPGMRGHNARFVVTNLSEELYDARHVYEDLLLRAWRHGEPDQRAAALAVCGSDLYVQDAEQPVAALLLYYRQCNYDDHQGDCAQGHRDGNGAVRNHPCEAAEGRRGPARQHTTVPPIVFLGLSVAVVIRPCTGEFARD